MKKFINQFLSNSLFFFLLTALAGALNYLCQLLLGRTVTVDNYGRINVIFSILLIVGVPGLTYSTLISRSVSKLKSLSLSKEIDQVANINLRAIVTISIALFLLAIFLVNLPFEGLAHGKEQILLITAASLATVFTCLFNGIMMGLGTFLALGFISLVLPMAKIASIGIIYFFKISPENQVTAVILSIVVGLGASIVLSIFYLSAARIQFNFKPRSAVPKMSQIEPFYVESFFVSFCFVLFSNLDILILKYGFNATTAGLYSSATIFGKIIFYFASAVVTIMVPSLANQSFLEKDRIKILNITLLLTILVTVSILIPINIFPEFFLQILFGQQFTAATTFVLNASLIAIVVSANSIVLNYAIGIGKLTYFRTTMTACFILLGFTLYLKCRTPSQALTEIALIGLILFLINYWHYVIKPTKVIDIKTGIESI